MQPSTWNDTNQHWIPQFLLKGFGIHSKSSTIYELDKQTKVVTVRDVSEAASKTHLLTNRDDEFMRDIESRAVAAVHAIRKGRLNRIGEDHRQAVDRLVCAMILNNLYSGFDAEATRRKVIAEEISELSETVKRYCGMLDGPDLRDFFDASLNHDWVSSIMESTSNQSHPRIDVNGVARLQTGTARLQYAQCHWSQQRHRCRTQLRPAPYRPRPVTYRSTGR